VSSVGYSHYASPYRHFPYVSPYYRSSYLLGRWNHGGFAWRW
jgi:hypothetical protein